MKLGITVFAFGLASYLGAIDLCAHQLRTDGIRPDSKFLKDVARYLTGDETDAEAVYSAYKRRYKTDDLTLPYPREKPAIAIPENVDTLLNSLGLDAAAFSDPPCEKWQKSTDGRWTRRLILRSKVKGKPRLITRRKAKGGEPAVSIAQTWNSEKDSASRETEITVQRANSQDWDYFVYDEKGILTAESTFYSSRGVHVRGPAPLTCLTCHYDRPGGHFSNFPLSYLSAEKLSSSFERISD